MLHALRALHRSSGSAKQQFPSLVAAAFCGLELAAARSDPVVAAAASVAYRSGLAQQPHQAAWQLPQTGWRCFSTDAGSSGTPQEPSSSLKVSGPGASASAGGGAGTSYRGSRPGNLGSSGNARPRRLSGSFGSVTTSREPENELDELDREFAQLDALLREDKVEDAWALLEEWYPDPEGAPSLEEELQQALAYDPEEEERQARRQRELQQQEAQAKRWVRVVDHKGKAYGTGKRKTSIARVWVWEVLEPEDNAAEQVEDYFAAAADGVLVPVRSKQRSTKIFVNSKPLDQYFKTMEQRSWVISPLGVTGNVGRFQVHATVEGGGTTGQAQALRHGLSRALQAFDPEMRPTLRAFGFLTRDPRIVERKKPGKAKARKSFQWVKR